MSAHSSCSCIIQVKDPKLFKETFVDACYMSNGSQICTCSFLFRYLNFVDVGYIRQMSTPQGLRLLFLPFVSLATCVGGVGRGMAVHFNRKGLASGKDLVPKCPFL